MRLPNKTNLLWSISWTGEKIPSQEKTEKINTFFNHSPNCISSFLLDYCDIRYSLERYRAEISELHAAMIGMRLMSRLLISNK